jgi:hypothetical protein
MLRNKLLILWLTAITVVVVASALRDHDQAHAAPAAPRKLTLDELDVHRINVIEPDGKPRVIIASAARFPGAFLDGKEYPHPGRRVGGGLVFFNDEGTEAGGLAYRTDRNGKQIDNAAIFTMDQHAQNELMGMSYGNENGKRYAGLVVYNDYPEHGLVPVIHAYDELQRATTPATKQAAQTRLDASVKVGVTPQLTRMFVGKEGDDAKLVLGDRAGHPRLVLKVDAQGEPSFELLDATGKVVKRITAR